MPDCNSIAADLGEQYERLYGSETLDLSRPADGKSAGVFITPSGVTVHSVKRYLDEYLPKPERRVGTAKTVDVDSFIAHAKRFASPQSAIFASPERSRPNLVAVFDYHPASIDATDADWLKHRGEYAPQLSDEWKAWTANDGKLMAVADFAAFIESRITNVIVPNLDDANLKTFADLVQGRFAEPSDLLRLSRGLAINVETAVKNAVVLSTGEISVTYEETHKDGTGQPIQVANLFQICIPVFYAGALYRIAAWLRYRVVNGKIHFMYQLVRPDLVFDDAFKGIVEKVKTETALPVFLGTPEA